MAVGREREPGAQLEVCGWQGGVGVRVKLAVQGWAWVWQWAHRAASGGTHQSVCSWGPVGLQGLALGVGVGPGCCAGAGG